MKLLSSKKLGNYHEIEIESTFLWFKWRRKYRKINESLFRFEEPNEYFVIGLSEYIDIKGLFDVDI